MKSLPYKTNFAFFLICQFFSDSFARYIYIDLGTNDGSSVDAFLPTRSRVSTGIQSDGSASTRGSSFFSAKSENATSIDPMYDKANYEIYAIEANPRYTPALLKQQERYLTNKISKSYVLYNSTGISIKNGRSQLILDCSGIKESFNTFNLNPSHDLLR